MNLRMLPLGVLLLLGLLGCQSKTQQDVGDEESASSASRGDLEISTEAQESIGLETVAVKRRETQDCITATGWLALPPSSEVIAKAPTTGFVTLPKNQSPLLGRSVSTKDHLANLRVFLSPQEQAQLVTAKEEADILIEQSLASLKLAEEQLRQLENEASTVVAGTRLLDLREIVARSRVAEQEAREKLPFLPQEPYENGVRLKDVSLEAPLAGWVVDLHFTPRQLVVQGDPLWTIADWSRLWVRVPVYVANVPRVLSDQSVDVSVPGDESHLEGRPIHLPQATETGKQTLALSYAIDNAQGRLRPGQAVSVSLPTGEKSQRIVIPRTAILWDGQGDSWVYLRTSPTTFRRRKVELGQMRAEEVIVERGLEAGDEIVITGAEALYGEEFSWQIQGDDD